MDIRTTASSAKSAVPGTRTVSIVQRPFHYRSILLVTAISLAYLLLAAVLIGYKSDQLFLVLLFNVFFYLSGPTRRFILGFSIFIVFWILFDSMKAFPNYRFNTVHIESIYKAEKSLFGFRTGNGGVGDAHSGTGVDNGGVAGGNAGSSSGVNGGSSAGGIVNGGIRGEELVTPNEYWLAHHRSGLDILAGLFYLCWIPLPLAFAGYLFYRNKEMFLRFALTFLLVNLLGFVIYYVYPAAPPWYVQQYGFQFNAHTPGNTAGLGRFDRYFNVSVFSSLYAKSSNVFAAMPSLHASYPLTVFYYGMKNRMGKINILFAVIMVGIWFAAVYSSHHYVLDVLAGIACGLTGITLFNYWYGKKGGWLQRFVGRYARMIEPASP